MIGSKDITNGPHLWSIRICTQVVHWCTPPPDMDVHQPCSKQCDLRVFDDGTKIHLLTARSKEKLSKKLEALASFLKAAIIDTTQK